MSETCDVRRKRADDMGCHAKQRAIEIEAAYALVAARQPAVMVEIGSRAGGSLYTYAGACAPGATLIAVDDCSIGSAARALAVAIEALRAEGFCAHLVRGHSQDRDTLDAVLGILDRREIDFLHIDGAHDLTSVLSDWRMYSAHVSRQALIAFHDIATLTTGVPSAWRALRETQRHTLDIVASPDRRGDQMGIGIIWSER